MRKQFVFSRALGGNSAVPCRSQAVAQTSQSALRYFTSDLVEDQTNHHHIFPDTSETTTMHRKGGVSDIKTCKKNPPLHREQKDGQTGNRNRDLVYAKDALYH
jgi:hypothetical protein